MVVPDGLLPLAAGQCLIFGQGCDDLNRYLGRPTDNSLA